jgi:hypothetical protein
MGLRETLNKKSGVGIVVSAAVLICAAVAIVKETSRSEIPKITKAFYSDDDGASYFLDEVNQLVPFDHNGKQAVGAAVFKSAEGTAFVGYLFRYTDKTRTRIKNLSSRPYTEVAQEIEDARSAGTEVKSPGAPDSAWVNQNSARGADIMNPKGPDGGAVAGVSP